MNKSETQRMVDEAYEAIYFPPEYIPPHITDAIGWAKSNLVLNQMANEGIITRREAMERMEIHE